MFTEFKLNETPKNENYYNETLRLNSRRERFTFPIIGILGLLAVILICTGYVFSWFSIIGVFTILGIFLLLICAVEIITCIIFNDILPTKKQQEEEDRIKNNILFNSDYLQQMIYNEFGIYLTIDNGSTANFENRTIIIRPYNLFYDKEIFNKVISQYKKTATIKKNDIKKLKQSSLFMFRLLHEIGHLKVGDVEDFNDKITREFIETAATENKPLIKSYINLPNEQAANQWTCRQLIENAAKWTKLYDYISNKDLSTNNPFKDFPQLI